MISALALSRPKEKMEAAAAGELAEEVVVVKTVVEEVVKTVEEEAVVKTVEMKVAVEKESKEETWKVTTTDTKVPDEEAYADATKAHTVIKVEIR